MSQIETEKTDIPKNHKRKKPTTSTKEEEIQNDKKKRLQNNHVMNRYLSNFEKWPIFTLLEDEFLLRIDLALIYNDGALIITKDKITYAIGNNKNNRLGIPEKDYILRPTKVEVLCEKNLKKFIYGYSMAALTEEGEVYVWSGQRKYTRAFDLITRQYKFIFLNKPIKVYELKQKHIIDIACNELDFLLLTDDGKVYSWNWYFDDPIHILSSSELKSKSKSDFSSEMQIIPQHMLQIPEKRFDENKIVCIACGFNFFMAVTDMGEVYKKGWKYLDPQKITELSHVIIVKVVCGHSHTLALTNEGQLYVLKQTCSLLNIPKLQKVLDIAAVYHSNRSAILGDNGYIYVWGDYFKCNINSPIVTHFSNMQEALMFRIDAYPIILFMNELKYIVVQSDILKCSQTLFDDPSTSDFTIQLKNHSIHVHKAILSSRSQYFENMFSNFKEKDQSIMTLPASEYSYTAYKAFLRYLYTGVIDLPMQKLLKLFKLAMMLCDSKLITSCIQEIKRKVTLANVVFVYNTAMEENNVDLKKFSIKFAVDYAWSTTQIEYNKKIDESILESFKEEIANASASSYVC